MTPAIGVMRPITLLPWRPSTKNPIQFAMRSVAFRPFVLPLW
jgi:hypothetical protein